MQKYKRTEIVEAAQWFKPGDVEGVGCYFQIHKHRPDSADQCCCGNFYKDHGLLRTEIRTNVIICPGDYIILENGRPVKAVKPAQFEREYERVE